jgi:hypothetical protein
MIDATELTESILKGFLDERVTNNDCDEVKTFRNAHCQYKELYDQLEVILNQSESEVVSEETAAARTSDCDELKNRICLCRATCFSALRACFDVFMKGSRAVQSRLVASVLNVMAIWGSREALSWDVFQNSFQQFYDADYKRSVYRYYTHSKLKKLIKAKKLSGTIQDHIDIHEAKYQDLLDMKYPLQKNDSDSRRARKGKKREKLPDVIEDLNRANDRAATRASDFVSTFLHYLFTSDKAWELAMTLKDEEVMRDSSSSQKTDTEIVFPGSAKTDDFMAFTQHSNVCRDIIRMRGFHEMEKVALADMATKYAKLHYRVDGAAAMIGKFKHPPGEGDYDELSEEEEDEEEEEEVIDESGENKIVEMGGKNGGKKKGKGSGGGTTSHSKAKDSNKKMDSKKKDSQKKDSKQIDATAADDTQSPSTASSNAGID